MPIRQPIPATIHTSDFRDKMYCFAVESILPPQQRMGMLTISTSIGYLLTTSLNKEPRREHTFDHHQEADGNWLAQGDATVWMTGESPLNGTIAIRNSLAETVVLTIDAATTSLELAKPLTLTVSQPTLAFAQTSPGKPSFLVLTIAQPHTNEPVTLTTDAPEYFQLASDSRPAFLPTLTLTPAATGSYIHVRYFANKSGSHTGQLTIHNSYERKVVDLEGRSSGFLPAMRQSWPTVVPIVRRRSKLVVGKQWAGVLALVIVSGLAYAGYTNRCQLFPALCHEPESGQTRVISSAPRPALVTANNASERVALNTAASEGKTSPKPIRPQTRESPEKVVQAPLASPEVRQEQTTSTVSDEERPVEAEVISAVRSSTVPTKQPATQNKSSQPGRQMRQRRIPTSPSEESDLEREINKPQ